MEQFIGNFCCGYSGYCYCQKLGLVGACVPWSIYLEEKCWLWCRHPYVKEDLAEGYEAAPAEDTV
jgi:hypothetical protein